MYYNMIGSIPTIIALLNTYMGYTAEDNITSLVGECIIPRINFHTFRATI